MPGRLHHGETQLQGEKPCQSSYRRSSLSGTPGTQEGLSSLCCPEADEERSRVAPVHTSVCLDHALPSVRGPSLSGLEADPGRRSWPFVTESPVPFYMGSCLLSLATLSFLKAQKERLRDVTYLLDNWQSLIDSWTVYESLSKASSLYPIIQPKKHRGLPVSQTLLSFISKLWIVLVL